ncbi:MAG: hypothetical protein ACKOWF_17815, partial [Chloroflexota bacterium]
AARASASRWASSSATAAAARISAVGAAADALLDALREAEARAAGLLRVLPEGGGAERTVGERALALFLLDPSSLANLTRAMRRLVDDAAREGQPK